MLTSQSSDSEPVIESVCFQSQSLMFIYMFLSGWYRGFSTRKPNVKVRETQTLSPNVLPVKVFTVFTEVKELSSPKAHGATESP